MKYINSNNTLKRALVIGWSWTQIWKLPVRIGKGKVAYNDPLPYFREPKNL